MSSLLNGKKILFFSQYFFGYENKITKKMQDMGAEVLLYDEMSVKRPLERALLKISPKVFIAKTRRYYEEILEEVKDIEIDYVLFIDCEMPDELILKKYRKTFSSARFCLHMWDSIDNLKGVDKKFKFFDVITTFDRADAEKYKLTLRPLFFSDEYRIKGRQTDYKYDLTFIGTIHSDRYRIVKAVKKQVELGRFFVYPYLQSKFIYYWYKLTKPEFKDTKQGDFCYEKIGALKLLKL